VCPEVPLPPAAWCPVEVLTVGVGVSVAAVELPPPRPSTSPTVIPAAMTAPVAARKIVRPREEVREVVVEVVISVSFQVRGPVPLSMALLSADPGPGTVGRSAPAVDERRVRRSDDRHRRSDRWTLAG
jgi:hypothetical protein